MKDFLIWTIRYKFISAAMAILIVVASIVGTLADVVINSNDDDDWPQHGAPA